MESAAGTRQEETAMDFLPAPHILRYGEGIFAMEYSTRITLTDTEPSALLYAGMLRETIETETGLCLPVFRGAAGEGDIILRMDAALRADTYRLSVSPLGAAVLAGGGEALCHGVQTLRQWIERNGARLPAIEIEDWPDLPNRGYYLDVSRGRVPTLETLKRYADLLCRYKINEWQLYVEHTYLFAGLSEAWRDDTPLTAGEIMELDAYCRDRCIELVPSLSTFGHMYKILSTKTCCDLCELENSEKIPFSYTYAGDHHTLNVSNPRALDFIKGMITEYMQLFTSRKFNICADETFDLGKGRSQGLAREAGERALYMNHVKALCEFVVEQGRTPMFWGDIVWRYKDAYAMLPKETICLNWGYLPNQREDEIRTLAEIGATQYVCPGVCTWNRWVPLIRDSFNNNRAMCGHGRKYGAVGLLNTDWGDYGHICHPWFSIPGILYGAAFAWNADEISFEEVNRAISRLEYGDASESFMEGFVALSQNEVFEWFRAVRWIEEHDEARREEIFSEVDTSRVPEANAAVLEAVNRLYKAARCMSAEKRGILNAVSIVADGVRIWNDIALYITKTHGGKAADEPEGALLAARLEDWYHAYMGLWRGVSREGGLPKTMRLIADYADTLRGRQTDM